MDRETKAAFAGVTKRLDKLVEGQDLFGGQVDKVEAQLARAAGLINALTGEVRRLTEDVGRLADGQVKMSAAIGHLGERMDSFAEQVMRGFTRRDEEHAAIEARVIVLERDR